MKGGEDTHTSPKDGDMKKISGETVIQNSSADEKDSKRSPTYPISPPKCTTPPKSPQESLPPKSPVKALTPPRDLGKGKVIEGEAIQVTKPFLINDEETERQQRIEQGNQDRTAATFLQE